MKISTKFLEMNFNEALIKFLRAVILQVTSDKVDLEQNSFFANATNCHIISQLVYSQILLINVQISYYI